MAGDNTIPIYNNKMTDNTINESEKFVQANRGPLGRLYESIRIIIHDRDTI